ncbi:hypothetical protein [Arthrobacter sp. zg-Y179]|nr:hypothetical protein [Arthrobacter sp. zg-Y179]MCC9174883.1 hypothetical protein [Arthrobacter sp. zg-Y179]
MGTIESRKLHALVDAAIEGLPPAAQAAPRLIVDIGSAHTRANAGLRERL